MVHPDFLIDRRNLLRGGSVAAAGVVVGRPARAEPRPARARSVILLWMAGGFTHHESFDPKPDAPEEIRGSLATIQTGLAGVRFAEVVPELARLTHHFALVRTFGPGNDDHFLAQAMALSGRTVTPAQITSEPNVGAIVSKLHGPRAGFPGYIAGPGTTRPGPPPKNLFVGGWLGAQYGPFSTGGRARNEDFTARVKEDAEEQFAKQGVKPFAGLTTKRLSDRRSLREKLDGAARSAESAGFGEQYRGAFDMLVEPRVRAAFDLDAEPPPVRDRYGRTKIGARCLLARRLVEAGARFVLVDYGYDPEYGNLWDNHNAPGQNFPHICEMAKRPYHVAGVDRALASLLVDLADRGRLTETLVVLHTEFGRTPRINKAGGRDHWGKAGSILFAGGGVRGGQVIGATDKTGAYPTTTGYGPGDVAATIYAALGIDPDTLLYDRQNRPLPVLPEGRVIPLF